MTLAYTFCGRLTFWGRNIATINKGGNLVSIVFYCGQNATDGESNFWVRQIFWNVPLLWTKKWKTVERWGGRTMRAFMAPYESSLAHWHRYCSFLNIKIWGQNQISRQQMVQLECQKYRNPFVWSIRVALCKVSYRHIWPLLPPLWRHRSKIEQICSSLL